MQILDAEHSHSDSLDLHRPLPPRRRIFDILMGGIAILLMGLAVVPLFSVLVSILQRGFAHLSWQTLTSLPAPMGATGATNGIGNAIVGTLIMVAIAAVISIPIGMMTAIYLVEFGQNSGLAFLIRFVMVILSGVPSIVVGVFAYGVIVLSTKRFSALAGSFALFVIMLPIVTLSTESALLLVSPVQRLASAALGGNQFQTIWRIVLKSAMPGIVTGILLAVARAAGETAPLIFTALSSDNWFSSLKSPTASLAVLIYNNANSPFPEQNAMAWTAALVLLGGVLLISIISRLVMRRFSVSR
jgi:phosphate transport system permease protein